MAAAAWKGAVEFGGFPVHVRLFSRKKSRGSESFRTLAPNGLPVKSQYVDTEGNPVERSETSKGVEVSKDSFVALSPDAVEQIASMEKSTSVEPRQFSPLESVPLELATMSYVVIPDKDVAGADGPVNVLWNGLRKQNLAYCTQVAMRSGSRDSILVLYARDDGLYAAALPFGAELTDTPSHEFTEDKKAQGLFSQFVAASYKDELGSFDLSEYESEHAERRQKAIDAALSGKPVQMPEAPEQPAGGDLMAVLEAAVAEEGGKAAQEKPKPKARPKGSKTTSRKKVTA